MRGMLRNSSGRHDAMLTLSVITLVLILVKVLIAGVTVTVGTGSVMLGTPMDGGLVVALLGPTLGAYVARRNGIGSRSVSPPGNPDSASQR